MYLIEVFAKNDSIGTHPLRKEKHRELLLPILSPNHFI